MFYGRTKESKFYFRTSRLRRSKLTSQFFVGIHLQLLDDVLGTRELEVVHLRLTGSVGDLAVVEDNGVTTSTTVLVSPADALGELGVGVGEEELQQLVHNAQFKFFVLQGNTYNVIVLDAVGLTPGAHDEGIVVGQDGNNVNTLLTDLRELLLVLGDVVGRADGSEGTGEGEEDDLLVGPLLGGVVVDRDTTSGDVALLLGVGDVAVERWDVRHCWEKRGKAKRKRKGRNSREDNVTGERVTSLETRHCELIW